MQLTLDGLKEKLSEGKIPELDNCLYLIPIIENKPEEARLLIQLLDSDNPLITLRAANILRKASATNVNILEKNKDLFQALLSRPTSKSTAIELPLLLQKIRWESSDELEKVTEWLLNCYDSPSVHTFTKVNCLDSLAEIALLYDYNLEETVEIIRLEGLENTKASIRARSKKILKRMEKETQSRKNLS